MSARLRRRRVSQVLTAALALCSVKSLLSNYLRLPCASPPPAISLSNSISSTALSFLLYGCLHMYAAYHSFITLFVVGCSYRSYYVCRCRSCGDGAPHGQPAPAAAAAAAAAAAGLLVHSARSEGPPASRHAGSVVVVDPRPHARPPHGELPVITARRALRRRGRLLAAARWWWL